MKTPWINYEKMHQITVKQNAHYFQHIYRKSTEESNDISDSDTEPSSVDTVETYTDAELVSQVDEDFVADHVIERNDSTEFEDVLQTDHADETNVEPQSDSAIESVHPSESNSEKDERNHTTGTYDLSELSDYPDTEIVSQDEDSLADHVIDRNDSTEFEDVLQTNHPDETNVEPQSDSAIESVHPSESNSEKDERTLTNGTYDLSELSDYTDTELVSQDEDSVADHVIVRNDSTEFEDILQTDHADETNDESKNDSAIESVHPSESNSKKDERNHTTGTYDLSELSDNTDTEIVSQDEDSVADHVIVRNDSTEFEDILQTDHADETNDEPQSDSAFEPADNSESNFEVEINDIHYTEDDYETNPTDYSNGLYKCGNICSMTTKTPFSTSVEINDFLHPPIIGGSVQNTSGFLDLNNKQVPELNTILFNTTTHYPEQPHCRLVCSKIHESIFLTTATDQLYDTKNNIIQNKAVANLLHDSSATIPEKSDHTSDSSLHFINIRVPVEIGEYEIEILLEENVVFEEEIMRIKEISKEVVLTDYKFEPTQINQALSNGACKALKGNLFIEGYVQQHIEYTAGESIQKEPITNFYHLHQKIVLNLIVQLHQVQRVQIKSVGTTI